MMKVLDAMKVMPSLKYVDVTCNNISTMLISHIRALLTSNVNLEGFRMEKLVVSQSELDELSDILPRMRAQDISFIDCGISDDHLKQLCVMLSNNSNISSLNIQDCVFSDKCLGFPKLIKSLSSARHLKVLKLSRMVISNQCCNYIAAMIAVAKNIQNFYMKNCTFREQGMANFFNAFKNISNLHCFSVSDIAVYESVSVSNAYKASNSITHVSLINSKLQNKDVSLVCETFKSITTLVHLNLSGNNISNQSAKNLTLGIAKNEGLQHLELSNCSLHESSLSSVCLAIKDRNLCTLNLSHNCISDSVAVGVACAVLEKRCIKVLKLRKCLIKVNGFQTLLSAFEKVKTLKDIDISYNNLINKALDITPIIVANPYLENLDFSYCGLCEIMITAKPSNLKVLNISGNDMSNLAAINTKKFISKSTLLHTLSLSKSKLNETALMKILLKMKHTLKHFNLSFNTISDKVAKLVADIIQSKCINLEHLNLSNCYVKQERLAVILKAVIKTGRLKYLNLDAVLIDDVLARVIAELITGSAALTHLSLSKCMRKESVFLQIVDSLQNANLIYLDISSNVITNNIAVKLIRSKTFHEKSQLSHCNLSQCDMQDSSLTIMLNAAMKINRLRYINVSDHKMDDIEVQRLAACITANDTLEQLKLARCEMLSAGLLSVLDVLTRICTLKHLDLSCNLITDEAIPKLAEAMSLNQIEHLDLAHSLQATKCSEIVLTAIANSVTFQYLDLSYNDISDSCVASAIASNEYLHHVNLTNNNFSIEGLKAILKAMARLRSLRHVDLSSFTISDELEVDIKAVAISNPGLENIVVFQSDIQHAKLKR